MSTITTNYGLVVPELTDSPPDITVIGANFPKIDTQMKTNADAAASAASAASTAQTGITEHEDDTVAHVTATERTAWNAKADATALTTHAATTATSSVLGHVKPDGTTITAASGVISAVTPVELTKSFTVKTGETVTAKQVVEFVSGGLQTSRRSLCSAAAGGTASYFYSAGAATIISACVLSSTSVLVTYKSGATGYLMAVVLTISGTTVTAGTPVVVSDEVYGYTATSICALNSTTAIISCSKTLAGGGHWALAIPVTISGTTITVGSSLIVSSYDKASYGLSVCRMTDSTALMVCNNTDYSCAYVSLLTISGTSITKSSTVAVTSIIGYLYYPQLCPLSETTAVLACCSYSSQAGEAVVITISGTTIGLGGAYTFCSNYLNGVTMTKLSSEKILIAYEDNGNSNYGYAVVATVSGGTVLSFGTALVFNSTGITAYLTACAMSDREVLIAFQNSANSGYGTAVLLTISGTTITKASTVVFASVSSGYTYVCKLTGLTALVAYENNSTTYGLAQVLTTSGYTFNPTNIIGIAKETKSGGSSCKVSLGPITQSLSGLTAGSMYYVDMDGDLSTTAAYYRLGLAVSATELKQQLVEL